MRRGSGTSLADENLSPQGITLVGSASQREPGSPAWLKTSGLNRLACQNWNSWKCPFPGANHRALLDELAARIAEDGPPHQALRMAVGPELELGSPAS